MGQLLLPFNIDYSREVKTHIETEPDKKLKQNYLEKLILLLSQDLDFCSNAGNHGSHTLHSFPAKFPPELPRKFIKELTDPGETVLDPMVGSGTTIIESFISDRYGIGFDIDPLALLMSQVKIAQFDKEEIKRVGGKILAQATHKLRSNRLELTENLRQRWDKETQEFIDYWFAPETQLELLALITEIEKIPNKLVKSFFELIFSAIIITKSGGVSFALDLAHTRPHRAKIVKSYRGKMLLDECNQNDSPHKIEILTKTVRSPIDEFAKRLKQNLENILKPTINKIFPKIEYGNAQSLNLNDASVDLIVTSPPYASNAIDYMRAHKFSLVWMGYSISQLSKKRKHYIGSDMVSGVEFEELPFSVNQTISDIADTNQKKGNALYRYYSEMARVLYEMFRVLKPGKAAIVVVGNSILSGKDTKIQACLADIGISVGFQVPKIGVRRLDRNRRMLPVGSKINTDSIIQQRMHEEFIIGFYKPEV